MNALNEIVFVSDDESIKLLLCENSVVMPPPEPPLDVCIASVKDGKRKFIWLVMRFFQPGDDGYTAIGLPETTPHDDVMEVWKTVLSEYDHAPFNLVHLPELATN